MKVCVIHMQRVTGEQTDNDRFCDPGRYIPSEIHHFQHHFIHKGHIEQDIDGICNDKTYDFYLSCLGNPEQGNDGDDAAATVMQAARYLERRLAPEKLVGNTVHALQLATPYSDRFRTAARLNHDISSEEEVHVNVVILEMGHAVVALEPIVQQHDASFNNSAPDNKKLLITDEPRRTQIRQTAEAYFKDSMGLQGTGIGWCEVVMRINTTTPTRQQQIHVLKVDPCPKIFCSSPVDDVITKTYPGSHRALFDTLLATRIIQTNSRASAQQNISTFFNKFSQTYDLGWDIPSVLTLRNVLAVEHDWTGSILDLACGSGFLGQALHEAAGAPSSPSPFNITGVDVSPSMASSDRIKKYYLSPIHIEPLERYIMKVGEQRYDHVACFNTLHYLPPVVFSAVLSRMFKIASRSISFDLYDPPGRHIDRTNALIGAEAIFNNTGVMRGWFGTTPPVGWKQVMERRQHLFKSPVADGVDVWGTFYRFERDERDECFTSGRLR
ncbi:hypothetical protein QBC40DRAFT_351646 [Triangularia verruculosa]|uniref:Methyltransferase domain-containing protein n=1 Tax=Triangularia verruculosa TaxID=2587418 RepID=A0AAN6XBQ2_9PEZI|nr:hypothetical protein QBC40DRAFT_351646 [Triangularia verruculosa]